VSDKDKPKLKSPGVSINSNLNAADLGISNGALTKSYVDAYVSNSQPYEVLHAKSGPDTMHIKGKLVIEDGTSEVDVSDFIQTMKERMLILQPNFEAHERYPALKDAYDQYKMMEKLLLENNNVEKD